MPACGPWPRRAWRGRRRCGGTSGAPPAAVRCGPLLRAAGCARCAARRAARTRSSASASVRVARGPVGVNATDHRAPDHRPTIVGRHRRAAAAHCSGHDHHLGAAAARRCGRGRRPWHAAGRSDGDRRPSRGAAPDHLSHSPGCPVGSGRWAAPTAIPIEGAAPTTGARVVAPDAPVGPSATPASTGATAPRLRRHLLGVDGPWAERNGPTPERPIETPIQTLNPNATKRPGQPAPPFRRIRRAGALHIEKSGGDLLSQGVSPQVPSALAVFTSVFGMGTGVTPPLWPPETYCVLGCQASQELQSEHEQESKRARRSQALGRLVPVG